MSSLDINRRTFLRGNVNARRIPAVVRPPHSLAESQFIEICSRCDSCISACQENIIVKGDGGYPEVDFKKGECTFCNECADVCEPNAILNEKATPWQLDVSITPKCLSLNAVVCRACSDNCEAQAIHFQLKLRGVSEPHISLDDCTGCGACLYVCPVGAIQIKPLESIAA